MPHVWRHRDRTTKPFTHRAAPRRFLTGRFLIRADHADQIAKVIGDFRDDRVVHLANDLSLRSMMTLMEQSRMVWC